jgi:hypothetical protein
MDNDTVETNYVIKSGNVYYHSIGHNNAPLWVLERRVAKTFLTLNKVEKEEDNLNWKYSVADTKIFKVTTSTVEEEVSDL